MAEEGYDFGRGFISLLPSFRGWDEAVNRQMNTSGVTGGRNFAQAFQDTVRAQLGRMQFGPSDSDTARQGSRTGGKFADGFKAKVEAALRSLPDVEIDANSTDAQVKVARLREELQDLSRQRVGIDIDAAAANAQIDRIRLQLEELSRSGDIQMRVDTGEAAAQLAALRGEIDSTKRAADDLGRTNASPNISINTGPALAAISTIRDAILALSAGAVITPLIGGATALLGPLAAAGAGVGGVLGASLPGLSNVKNALSSQSAANKASASGSGRSSGGSSNANQTASAELSLADTRRQIANSQVQADQQVKNAEQQLANAQQAAVSAQKALTDARAAGARQLQDMAFAAQDASLQLQQDQIAVTQAEQNLDAVNKNSKSTALQRREAALQLAEAQQALIEQQVTARRATDDNNAAQKAGVNGTPQVIAAQQQLTSADQQRNAARQAVADAERQRTFQAAQNASSLQRAELAVAQAQTAGNSATTRGSAAANTYAAALAKLDPQQRSLYNQVLRSKSAFLDFAHSLEPVTLPLFTNGLKILDGLLPKIEPLIRATATALGGIETSIRKAVNGPGFKTFVDTLTKLVGPSLKSLAAIGGNLGGVFAHVVEAFAPLSGVVLGGLQKLTGALSKAAQSPGLKAFVAQLVALAPTLVRTLSSVGGLVGKVFQALAPLAAPVLSVINTLATALASVVTGIGPSVAEFFKTLGPLVSRLLVALAPLVTKLITGLLPILTQLTQAVAPIISTLLPPLVGLFTSLFRAVAPLVPVLAGVIATILPPLASLLAATGRALVPVVTALVQALAPALPQIAKALAQFLTALVPLLPQLTKLYVALIPIIPPLASLIVQILKLATSLLPLLTPLLKQITTNVGSLVGAVKIFIAITAFWIRIIQDVINWLKRLPQTVRAAGAAITSAWRSTWGQVKSAYIAVRDYLTGAFSAFARTASNLWQGIASGIATAFGAVKGAVRGVWHDVETIFSNGVNFVTQKIIDPLISVLNSVLGVFGVPKIAKIPALNVGGGPSGSQLVGKTGKFATGGVLPGYTPGTDGIAIPQYHFSGGEGILVPEATRYMGGARGIQAINSAFSSRVSTPGHFTGGGTTPGSAQIVGGGGISGVLTGVASTAQGIIGDIRSGAAKAAIAGLKVAEAPITALVPHVSPKLLREMVSGWLSKLNSSVSHFISGQAAKAASGNFGGPGVGGAGWAAIWKNLISVGMSRAQAAGVMGNMESESGGNPFIIQGGGTSMNPAAAGGGGYGLVQWTPGSKLIPYLNGQPPSIASEIAALAAQLSGKGPSPEGAAGAALRRATTPEQAAAVFGLDYERYAGGVQGQRAEQAVNFYKRFAAYDNGGFLPPGVSTVFNGTGRPEPVFTDSQWQQMANNGDLIRELRATRAAIEQGNHLTAKLPGGLSDALNGTARLANLLGRTSPAGVSI